MRFGGKVRVEHEAPEQRRIFVGQVHKGDNCRKGNFDSID